MSLLNMIKKDFESIANTGFDEVVFRNTETSQTYRTQGFVTRRTQTFVPLTAESIHVPVNSVTIAQSGFDKFAKPKELRHIEISYIDIEGIVQVFIAKEMREDFSNGRITFLLGDKYDSEG